ncbi:hypothetical protein [Mycetohabitans endofungorum]|uniref:hypothetical protein n=1 Tax=Mycetohabitans endofungorum TaxID=417203 RepID=UPI002B06124B|nr:hypothetical protein [Mycetohabitans endofungorum]
MKLILAEGEIDFVVSQNLTDPSYDEWVLMDQPVKVETAAEIVAKKCGTAAIVRRHGTCSI